MAEKEVGVVTHYFSRISVAGIRLTDVLREGDTIHIVGSTTDFTQEAHSMQLENEPVAEGRPGQEVGLKVQDRVRVSDKVYVVS